MSQDGWEIDQMIEAATGINYGPPPDLFAPYTGPGGGGAGAGIVTTTHTNFTVSPSLSEEVKELRELVEELKALVEFMLYREGLSAPPE